MLSPTLPNVSSAYGAPMGRLDTVGEPATSWTLRVVPLDGGGYDAGGAYWGIGETLWRASARDAEGDEINLFLRAEDREAASWELGHRYPGAEITREAIGPETLDPGCLPPMVAGFIEAMIHADRALSVSSEAWRRPETQAALAEGTLGGTLPEDLDASALSPESLRGIGAICRDFQERAGQVLEAAFARPDYDELQAGRDLYLVRAGHGTGFWDRPQLGTLGDELTEIAGTGEVTTSFSEDHELTVELG